jgi:hypothetical protein
MNTLPSNKKFGLFFSTILTSCTLASYFYNKDNYIIYILIAISLFFLICTIFYPHYLAPLNKIWYLIGNYLSKIVSPLVLAIIYFGIISPISLIIKIFGRDELILKRDKVGSYWQIVSNSNFKEKFKNQF